MYVGQPGEFVPGGPSGGHGTVTCTYHAVGGTTEGGVSVGPGEPIEGDPVEGEPYVLVCVDATGAVVYSKLLVYQPAEPAVDGATLARQAYRELPLLYPQPYTAPPADAPQLVGLRTWFWIDPGEWHDQSATASIPGLSATVTATPVETRWDTGDGTTVVCPGPGTPYDPSVPDEAQHTDCSHVFAHDGVHPVTATIVWRVRWTATDGTGGSLPDVERSTQFPLTAQQRQAVIDG